MQKVMDFTEKVVGRAVDTVKKTLKETEDHIHAKDEPERKKIPLPVNLHQKEMTTERLPQPKPSILASKYPRLKKIDSRLNEQNKVIFEREKKRNKLKKELSECTGIFKGGRHKELMKEVDGIETQISNIKKRLSSIVKEYHFDSVQAFYKEFNAAKREGHDYRVACADWEKTYGVKAADAMNVRDRLRQKEQIVKGREANRVHQIRQKDRGAR
jgi:hypothetical protein